MGGLSTQSVTGDRFWSYKQLEVIRRKMPPGQLLQSHFHAGGDEMVIGSSSPAVWESMCLERETSGLAGSSVLISN